MFGSNLGPPSAGFNSPRPSHRSSTSFYSPRRKSARGGERVTRRKQEVLQGEATQRAEIIAFFDTDRQRIENLFIEGVSKAKDATIERLERRDRQAKKEAKDAADKYMADLTAISRAFSDMVAACLQLGVGGDGEDADRKLLEEAAFRLRHGLGVIQPPPPSSSSSQPSLERQPHQQQQQLLLPNGSSPLTNNGGGAPQPQRTSSSRQRSEDDAYYIYIAKTTNSTPPLLIENGSSHNNANSGGILSPSPLLSSSSQGMAAGGRPSPTAAGAVVQTSQELSAMLRSMDVGATVSTEINAASFNNNMGRGSGAGGANAASGGSGSSQSQTAISMFGNAVTTASSGEYNATVNGVRRVSSSSVASMSLRRGMSKTYGGGGGGSQVFNNTTVSSGSEGNGNVTPPMNANATSAGIVAAAQFSANFSGELASFSPANSTSVAGAALASGGGDLLQPITVDAAQIQQDIHHVSATVQQLLHSAASRVRYSSTRLAYFETLLDQQQAQLLATERMLNNYLVRAPSDVDRSIDMVRHMGVEVSQRLDAIEKKALGMVDALLKETAPLQYLRNQANAAQREAQRELAVTLATTAKHSEEARARAVAEADHASAMAHSHLVNEQQKLMGKVKGEVRLLSEDETELIDMLRGELIALTKKRLVHTVGKSSIGAAEEEATYDDVYSSLSLPSSSNQQQSQQPTNPTFSPTAAATLAMLKMPESVRLQHLDAVEREQLALRHRIATVDGARYGVVVDPQHLLQYNGDHFQRNIASSASSPLAIAAYQQQQIANHPHHRRHHSPHRQRTDVLLLPPTDRQQQQPPPPIITTTTTSSNADAQATKSTILSSPQKQQAVMSSPQFHLADNAGGGGGVGGGTSPSSSSLFLNASSTPRRGGGQQLIPPGSINSSLNHSTVSASGGTANSNMINNNGGQQQRLSADSAVSGGGAHSPCDVPNTAQPSPSASPTRLALLKQQHQQNQQGRAVPLFLRHNATDDSSMSQQQNPAGGLSSPLPPPLSSIELSSARQNNNINSNSGNVIRTQSLQSNLSLPLPSDMLEGSSSPPMMNKSATMVFPPATSSSSTLQQKVGQGASDGQPSAGEHNNNNDLLSAIAFNVNDLNVPHTPNASRTSSKQRTPRSTRSGGDKQPKKGGGSKMSELDRILNNANTNNSSPTSTRKNRDESKERGGGAAALSITDKAAATSAQNRSASNSTASAPKGEEKNAPPPPRDLSPASSTEKNTASATPMAAPPLLSASGASHNPSRLPTHNNSVVASPSASNLLMTASSWGQGGGGGGQATPHLRPSRYHRHVTTTMPMVGHPNAHNSRNSMSVLIPAHAANGGVPSSVSSTWGGGNNHCAALSGQLADVDGCLLFDPSTVNATPFDPIAAAHAQARGGSGHYFIRSNIPRHHRERLERDTVTFDRVELLRLLDLVSHEPRVAEVICAVMDEYDAWEAGQKETAAMAEKMRQWRPSPGTKEEAESDETTPNRSNNCHGGGGAKGGPFFARIDDRSSFEHEASSSSTNHSPTISRPRAGTKPPDDCEPAANKGGSVTAATAPSVAALPKPQVLTNNSSVPPPPASNLLHDIIKGYPTVDKVINAPIYSHPRAARRGSEEDAAAIAKEEAEERRVDYQRRLHSAFDPLNVASRIAKAAYSNDEASDALMATANALKRSAATSAVGSANLKALLAEQRQQEVDGVVVNTANDDDDTRRRNLLLRSPEDYVTHGSAITAERYKHYPTRPIPTEGKDYVANNLYQREYKEAIMREQFEAARQKAVEGEVKRLHERQRQQLILPTTGPSTPNARLQHGPTPPQQQRPNTASAAAAGAGLTHSNKPISTAKLEKSAGLDPSTANDPPRRPLLFASPAGRAWYDSARLQQDALNVLKQTLMLSGAEQQYTIAAGGNGEGANGPAYMAAVEAAKCGAPQPFDVLPSLTSPRDAQRNLPSSPTAAEQTPSSKLFYRNPETQTPWSDADVMRLLKKDEGVAASIDHEGPSSARRPLQSKYDDKNPLAFVPIPPRNVSAESRMQAEQHRRLLEAFE